jgi:predicted dinucleotide-binding enzyme
MVTKCSTRQLCVQGTLSSINNQCFSSVTCFIQAFNTVGKTHLEFSDGSKIPNRDASKGPLNMLFAGNKDKEAEAAAVVAAVGFRPIYVGPIKYSRNLEAIAELWIHNAFFFGWGEGFHFEPTGR